MPGLAHLEERVKSRKLVATWFRYAAINERSTTPERAESAGGEVIFP